MANNNIFIISSNVFNRGVFYNLIKPLCDYWWFCSIVVLCIYLVFLLFPGQWTGVAGQVRRGISDRCERRLWTLRSQPRLLNTNNYLLWLIQNRLIIHRFLEHVTHWPLKVFQCHKKREWQLLSFYQNGGSGANSLFKRKVRLRLLE